MNSNPSRQVKYLKKIKQFYLLTTWIITLLRIYSNKCYTGMQWSLDIYGRNLFLPNILYVHKYKF